MFNKKDEKEKFDKVPQVEIDGELYHESTKVRYGIEFENKKEVVDGNTKTTLKYSLVKDLIIRDKVFKTTVIRSEEGLGGKNTILEQLKLEVKKEIKRVEGDL